MSTLFDRLDDKAKHKLLQILVNRIIVDPDGRIVDYELNRPFGYLSKLANDPNIKLNGQSGSKQVPFGVPKSVIKAPPGISMVGLLYSNFLFFLHLRHAPFHHLLR